MALFLISFIAGLLTVLAPCILPFLPVVIGSAASGRSRSTPYVVVGSLAVSVIVFTYLLKASTVFIMVPPQFWTYLSGGILTIFGFTLLWPALWEKVPGLAKVSIGSNNLLSSGYQRRSFFGDVLVGAALGPIFSTCSPTYFVILASVLPVSFALGTVYILAYVLGLSLVLLAIALLGQRFADRLNVVADPKSNFKRAIGLLFIVLGVLVATGYEKKLETKILDSGYFDITKVEQFLLQKTEEPTEDQSNVAPTDEQNTTAPKKKNTGVPYKEIVAPAGFVNTTGITIKELVGKKVILVDFLTYSCINCQRTFPYMVAWYDKYKDQGLEIVGIHTPEFAFEKDLTNVREAMAKFGIKYPIVLDNDYATWTAYGNRFWPRKYLIDIYGNVVYDHIGEGAYEETEMKIKELLAERAEVLGQDMPAGNGLAAAEIAPTVNLAQSPETYFGSLRNELLANGLKGKSGIQTLAAPKEANPNALYLVGRWQIEPEYAEAKAAGTSIIYRYKAKEVYIVADSDQSVEVEVWQDGQKVGAAAGGDVNAAGLMMVKESRLYKVINNQSAGEHLLELKIRSGGARFYAFTFG